MEAPGGASVLVETPGPAVLLVRRLEFDHALMTLAREAGAELAEGADITRVAETASGVRLESRDGRVFHAPIVVAADGVYSTVARRLGFNPGWPRDRVAIDMMEETPASRLRAVDEDTLWVSFAPGSGHGYGYIFPKRDYVNVGVGYIVSSFKASIRDAPHALHGAFVAGLAARGLLEGEADPVVFHPLPGACRRPAPHDRPRARLCRRRCRRVRERVLGRGHLLCYGHRGSGRQGDSRGAVAAPVRTAVAPRDRRRDARLAVPEPLRVRGSRTRGAARARRARVSARRRAAGRLRDRGGHL